MYASTLFSITYSSHNSYTASGLRSGCASVLLSPLAPCHHNQPHSINLQNKLVQTHQLRLTKYEIKVFQRLRHPEALALIQFLRFLIFRDGNVCDGRVGDGGHGSVVDGLEHAPCCVGECGVAGYAVEDEYGFDSFWSVCPVISAHSTGWGWVYVP